MSSVNQIDAPGWQTAWSDRRVRVIVSATIGGAVGYGSVDLLARAGWLAPIDPAVGAVVERGGWHVLGWTTVLILGAMGLFALVASLRDPWVRRAMELEAGEGLAGPRALLRIGGAGLAGYGVLVLVFLLPDLEPIVGIGAGIAAFVGVTALFFAGFRLSDELQAAATREACYWTFVVVETVLVAWALLHQFAGAGPLEPLPLVLLLVLSYALTSLIVAVRRGLAD